MSEPPFVSVIVPVYNDPEEIRTCLESLMAQTYPEDRYEVIVVDNDSTDNTPDVIREFPVYLEFERDIQGSYAARNTGISAADGEILAFTDADCDPHPTWIEEGVARLLETDADLAAGQVSFSLSDDPSAAARFDARANMRNDKGVPEGYAKTANLFVRATVVERIGEFPAELRSGGDVYWSRTVTESGFRLVYAAEAVVEHPPREFRELLKKQYRVGKGHLDLWRLEGRNPAIVLGSGFVMYPKKVFEFLFEDNSKQETETQPNQTSNPTVEDYGSTIGFLFVAVSCVVIMNVGRLMRLIWDTLWEG